MGSVTDQSVDAETKLMHLAAQYLHSMRATPQKSRIQDSALCHVLQHQWLVYFIQLTTNLADYTENQVAITLVSWGLTSAQRVLATEHKFPQSAAEQAINRRSASRTQQRRTKTFTVKSPPTEHKV